MTDFERWQRRYAARNGQQCAKAIREHLSSADEDALFERLAVSFAKTAHAHWRVSKRGLEGWEDLDS